MIVTGRGHLGLGEEAPGSWDLIEACPWSCRAGAGGGAGCGSGCVARLDGPDAECPGRLFGWTGCWVCGGGCSDGPDAECPAGVFGWTGRWVSGRRFRMDRTL